MTGHNSGTLIFVQYFKGFVFLFGAEENDIFKRSLMSEWKNIECWRSGNTRGKRCKRLLSRATTVSTRVRVPRGGKERPLLTQFSPLTVFMSSCRKSYSHGEWTSYSRVQWATFLSRIGNRADAESFIPWKLREASQNSWRSSTFIITGARLKAVRIPSPKEQNHLEVEALSLLESTTLETAGNGRCTRDTALQGASSSKTLFFISSQLPVHGQFLSSLTSGLIFIFSSEINSYFVLSLRLCVCIFSLRSDWFRRSLKVFDCESARK